MIQGPSNPVKGCGPQIGHRLVWDALIYYWRGGRGSDFETAEMRWDALKPRQKVRGPPTLEIGPRAHPTSSLRVPQQ